MLVREGEEAMEEVDVAGDGGLVDMIFGSIVVTTLGGFLIREETLRFLW